METYKMIVKRKMVLLAVFFIFISILGAYGFLTGNAEKADLSSGIVKGFQSGLIFGIGILVLVDLIKLSSVVKDDKKLKIAYNRENDERMKSIREKAGMPMLQITSVMMLLAAVTAGYFNTTVFYALAVAAIGQLLVGVIVKIYYMKTM
ncbi:hypothetical protein ACHAL6_11885 [Proteiniclasticum sp. C24MP]|uniref:hypothetical protein n=1 Tax=Proteiniclasticum sp. C24MP TaxID=3374101 RepID=UPI003754B26F